MTIRTVDAATPANFTIPNPEFGYKTTVELSTTIQKTDDGKYKIWDDGSTFDSRMCSANFLLSATDTNTLIDIIRASNSVGSVTKGRGVNVEITPDAGFFPFGPDKGDEVTFKTKMILVDQKPTVGHPEDYFNVDVLFVFTGSYPSYTPVAQIDMGELQIGSIQNLRYPLLMHKLSIDYAVDVSQTQDGTPHSNDRFANTDSYLSKLDLVLDEGSAAALIAHLQSTVRDNDVDIIPPENSYLFGREKNSSVTYTCKFVQNKIVVTHETKNRFSMDLNFSLISAGEA